MSDLPTTKKINMSLDDLIKKNKDEKRISKKKYKDNFMFKTLIIFLIFLIEKNNYRETKNYRRENNYRGSSDNQDDGFQKV